MEMKPLEVQKEAPKKDPTISELKTKKEQLAVQLKYNRDKDREMVRGIFHYNEVKGGFVEFVYKAYKEDQVEYYKLHDGVAYTLPLGVAKHLNKNGWYPVHAYALDEDGKASMKIGEKVRRFGFQSLEFVDIDDINPQLVTVERI